MEVFKNTRSKLHRVTGHQQDQRHQTEALPNTQDTTRRRPPYFHGLGCLKHLCGGGRERRRDSHTQAQRAVGIGGERGNSEGERGKKEGAAPPMGWDTRENSKPPRMRGTAPGNGRKSVSRGQKIARGSPPREIEAIRAKKLSRIPPPMGFKQKKWAEVHSPPKQARQHQQQAGCGCGILVEWVRRQSRCAAPFIRVSVGLVHRVVMRHVVQGQRDAAISCSKGKTETKQK